MRKNILLIVLVSLIGNAFPGQAQVKNNSFMASGQVSSFAVPSWHTAPDVKNTNLMITHSASQNIVQGTVACTNSGITAENHYLRAFNLLTEFGIVGDFNITDIQFGIENAVSGSGTGQPVTIKLHTLNGPMSFAYMTRIAKKDTIIPDMSAAYMMIPITATVGHGQVLIVDIHIPDGQTAGHTFFLGSNGLGQTAPSYLASEPCLAIDPVTYASIGHGNVHLVINVFGDVSAGIEKVNTHAMKTWPNPASEVLHLDLPQGSWAVEIMHISGKSVYQSNISGKATLTINHLPKGLYLLHANNGTTYLQEKVIIR